MATKFQERIGGRSNQQGFSLSELQDKLTNANNEILRLKIRIHLLEENQGIKTLQINHKQA